MPNYDEAIVAAYTLPELLTLRDGTPVADIMTWQQKRRPELLRLFADNIFGRTPVVSESVRFEIVAEGMAFGGLAMRKEIAVCIGEARFHLLLYVPTDAPKPCPVFLGLNFFGNHTVSDDPAVAIVPQWECDSDLGQYFWRLPKSVRGEQSSRWQVEMVLKRGYAVATACYGEIQPDANGSGRVAMLAVLGEARRLDAGAACGAIGIWAYGLSRIMDYLETDPAVDARRVALMGHSRLGKAALWAAAQDERFALVISNNSGAGGAALARRRFGESVADLVRNFPHWFCGH
ncbi:MAG: acetylxylan esterase, partial [Fibrella sp.]|nr:acetylxylan esterase [Armatimonadota bacterium]